MFAILTTASANMPPQKTEALDDIDAATRTILQVFHNPKVKLDIYGDSTLPAISINVETFTNLFLDLKTRGVKIRYITQISQDNLTCCREIMKYAELRHLEGIKGNFGLVDNNKEFVATPPVPPLATVAITQGVSPVSQAIYSNSKWIVEQQQYLFDTLWGKAIPAEQKIREIDGNIEKTKTAPTGTRIIEGTNEIAIRARYVTETSNVLLVCSTFGGLKMLENLIFDSLEKVLDKYKKGKHKGIRWIGTIEAEHLELVKKFLDLGMEIRHTKTTLLNFSVTNKEFNFTVDKMKGGKISSCVLISDQPIYINHFSSIFEELWKNGIDARKRIKEIEQGIDEDGTTKIIDNPLIIQKLLFKQLNSATSEILLILPSTNEFLRQTKLGTIQSLLNKAIEKNVTVRILTHTNDSIERILQDLSKHENFEVIRNRTDIAEVNTTTMVVDRKNSLAIEIMDDSSEQFNNSIGYATYSTSKPTVSSYITVFERLWLQTELYEQVKDSNRRLELLNEQLQIHDRMQQEFIDTAAHELRTPIMPIIGGMELLEAKLEPKDRENVKQEIEMILRNADRLQRLAEDILQVANIESNSFKLDLKEQVDLYSIIFNVIGDMGKKYGHKIGRVPIIFDLEKNDVMDDGEKNNVQRSLIVKCDQYKISQVLFNLLDNAMKFTEKGKVAVSVRKLDEKNDFLVVRIADTGRGIDPLIKDRLFQKFATKSEKGTGLGLYLSRKIIEAHGGRIWVENTNNNVNEQGIGAIFNFSLPS